MRGNLDLRKLEREMGILFQFSQFRMKHLNLSSLKKGSETDYRCIEESIVVALYPHSGLVSPLKEVFS